LATCAAVSYRVSTVRHAFVVVAALFVLMSSPLEARAHAVLVRSSPSARSTLARPPERVQLWFNERLEPAYSKVSVWDRGGQQVDAGDAAVDPGEPTRLAVGVVPLAPGTFTGNF